MKDVAYDESGGCRGVESERTAKRYKSQLLGQTTLTGVFLSPRFDANSPWSKLLTSIEFRVRDATHKKTLSALDEKKLSEEGRRDEPRRIGNHETRDSEAECQVEGLKRSSQRGGKGVGKPVGWK